MERIFSAIHLTAELAVQAVVCVHTRQPASRPECKDIARSSDGAQVPLSSASQIDS